MKPSKELAKLLAQFGMSDNGKWRAVPSVCMPYRNFWFNPEYWDGYRAWIVHNLKTGAWEPRIDKNYKY